MPYIRFLQDYTVKDADRTFYKAGQILECSATSAEHFKKRLAAVDCDPPEPVAAPAPITEQPIAASEPVDVPRVPRPKAKGTSSSGTKD